MQTMCSLEVPIRFTQSTRIDYVVLYRIFKREYNKHYTGEFGGKTEAGGWALMESLKKLATEINKNIPHYSCHFFCSVDCCIDGQEIHLRTSNTYTVDEPDTMEAEQRLLARSKAKRSKFVCNIKPGVFSRAWWEQKHE